MLRAELALRSSLKNLALSSNKSENEDGGLPFCSFTEEDDVLELSP